MLTARLISHNTAADRLLRRHSVEHFSRRGIECDKVAVEISRHNQTTRRDRNSRHDGRGGFLPPANDTGVRVNCRNPAGLARIVDAESIRMRASLAPLRQVFEKRCQVLSQLVKEVVVFGREGTFAIQQLQDSDDAAIGSDHGHTINVFGVVVEKSLVLLIEALVVLRIVGIDDLARLGDGPRNTEADGQRDDADHAIRNNRPDFTLRAIDNKQRPSIGPNLVSNDRQDNPAEVRKAERRTQLLDGLECFFPGTHVRRL